MWQCLNCLLLIIPGWTECDVTSDHFSINATGTLEPLSATRNYESVDIIIAAIFFATIFYTMLIIVF